MDAPRSERGSLEGILDESFTGLYLWHSRRTLKEIEHVRAATIDGRPVGLIMFKMLGESSGYIYYIAVSKDHRRKSIGGRLLDDSLDRLSELGAKEVYASVGDDNEESAALFTSRHFRPIGYGELSGRYGKIRALEMYKQMLVVPGEILLSAEVGGNKSEADKKV